MADSNLPPQDKDTKALVLQSEHHLSWPRRMWRNYKGWHPVVRIVIPFVFAFAFLSAGWNVLSHGEYGVALAAIILFIIFGVGAAIEFTRFRWLRTIAVIGVLIVGIYSIAVVLREKGDKPWTTLWPRLVLTPTPAPIIPPCANVYEPFRRACEDFKDVLGKPLRDAEPIQELIHEQHQRAELLMFNDSSPIFVLYNDGRLEPMKDLGVDKDEEYWLSDEGVIKQFKKNRLPTPPRGQVPPLYPPYGPVAKAWFFDHGWQEKIGWRLNHAMYEGGVARRLEFQGGMIVGIVRHIPWKDDSQSGRVFILLKNKDGKWDRWESSPYDKSAMPPWQAPHTKWN